MSALECAMKLSKEEVFEQIKTSGLLEYGLEKELLSDRLSHAIEESKEEEKELGVVAALNNADTTGVDLPTTFFITSFTFDYISVIRCFFLLEDSSHITAKLTINPQAPAAITLFSILVNR